MRSNASCGDNLDEKGAPFTNIDNAWLVRFLLPSTYLFLRCAPAFWKAVVCRHGLAHWL